MSKLSMPTWRAHARRYSNLRSTGASGEGQGSASGGESEQETSESGDWRIGVASLFGVRSGGWAGCGMSRSGCERFGCVGGAASRGGPGLDDDDGRGSSKGKPL